MNDLIERMKAVCSGSGDEEVWHITADQLLVEAVRHLATQLPPDQAAQVAELLAAYEDVPKWYA